MKYHPPKKIILCGTVFTKEKAENERKCLGELYPDRK
jgi:hypothetical protein